MTLTYLKLFVYICWKFRMAWSDTWHSRDEEYERHSQLRLLSDMKHTTRYIKKGDTFVQYRQKRPITFMVINEVEESNEHMEVCKVSWYSWHSHGINLQRRFPMAAREGMFFDFAPIPRKLFREAVNLMRYSDAEMKAMDESEKEAKKAKYTSCRRWLGRMIKGCIE